MRQGCYNDKYYIKRGYLMYKIKVFFSVIRRYIKLNPLVAVIPASILGVAAATALVFAVVNASKSDNTVKYISSETSAYDTAPVVPVSVPQIDETISSAPVIQPTEKQVEYKGKNINVAKVEIAEKDSKEDAENGRYVAEQVKQKAQLQTTDTTTPSAQPAVNLIEYKKPRNDFTGGIDVSSHNGEIDWAKVKADGVQFAMIRLGYRGYLTGKIVLDAAFEYNIENAYKNGIDVGVYFYSTATNETEALEEAAYVVEVIKAKEEKGIKLTYQIAYDFEEFYNKDDRTRAKGLTSAQISKNTAAFLDYIKSAGYKPMLYAGKNPVKTYWEPSVASKYDFWLAHYTEATEYTGKFFMWQYTSSGKVNGIDGRVDLNICGFENNDNLPQFLICRDDGVKALGSPKDDSEVLLTLHKYTVYLCRNTYDCEYKELKISGKYYYVRADELSEIPFVTPETAYKTTQDTVLYNKPFDDTYKTDMVLPAESDVEVVGIWQDKWAEIEYKGKTYYVKSQFLSASEQNEEENSSTVSGGTEIQIDTDTQSNTEQNISP